MTKQESSLNLRLKAEDAVKKRSIQVPNTLNSESVIDLHKMVHELQVHQVELEMQAEELQETQAALQQANQELERRVLEQTRQLRESEERFAAFMSHLPAAAFIKDTCGRILYANKYLQDLLNFQKWEVKTTQELVPEEVQQQMVEDDRKALAQGQIKTQETMTVSDGSRRTFETIKFAIRGEGIPALLGGIAFDITERKQAELELKISRDFLQGLIDRIADPVVVKDKRHRFALVNDAECMLAGQSREMLLGKTDLDFFPKEQVDVFWKMDVRVLETGEAHLNEETIQHGSTGESLTFLSHKTRYVDQCGNRFVVAVLSDITERKRAEVMLRGSEERFRNLLQTIPSVAVQGYSIDGTTQYWNQASEQLYGYSANEAIGVKLWDLIVPSEMQKDVMLAIRQMAETGRGIPPSELLLRRKDGSPVLVFSSHAVVQVSGRATELFCFDIDLTERNRAEEALNQSKAFLNSIIENSPNSLWISDQHGTLMRMNQACRDVLHLRDDEVVGKYNIFEDSILESQGFMPRVKDVYEKGVTARFITSYDTAVVTGLELERTTRVVLDVSISPIMDSNGKVTNAIIQHIDITERQRAVEALRKSEERFNLSMEATQDGLWDWDINTDKGYFSPSYYRMLGYEVGAFPEESKSWNDLIHPDDRKHALQANMDCIEDRCEVFEIEYRMKANNGEWRWILGRGKCIERNTQGRALRLVGTHVDITERKRAEAERDKLEHQNRQLKKSESLGRMAGAIAHHFNNQLQVVMMNLAVAMNSLPRDMELAERLVEAMQSARKAAEVSTLMLTYLGQTVPKRELLDLSDVCQQSLPKLRDGIPRSVSFDTELPTPGPTISANSNQIQQVLTNLMTNAWECSPGGQGAIRLTVKKVSASEIPAANRFPTDWQAQDIAYACLEVADNGSGIDDKDIEKLFDPFFSTKFTGRGMGLAVVMGIVRAHHGVVTVESKTGHGTIFRVYLPVSREAIPQNPIAAADVQKRLESGTVLVVDDEPSLRKIVANAIKGMGFTVLTAQDGVEAVKMFQQHLKEIRLVICDLTMPRMDGWETLTALRKLAPGIPVILASGYSEAQVMAGDHPELPQLFLSKPYEYETLSDAISRVIMRTRG